MEKLFLTVLSQITPLQIELFKFVMENKDVVDLTVHKRYAEEPRVEVTIIGEHATV